MRGKSPHYWFVVCLCMALTSCGAMSAPPVSLPAPISGRLSGPIEVVPESTPNTVTIHAPAGTTLAHATILVINVTVEQSISADGPISGDGLCAGLVRFCITADANGGFSFTIIASPGDRIDLVVVDLESGKEISARYTITIVIDVEGNSFVELEEGEALQGIALLAVDATTDEVTVAGASGSVKANATLLLVNEDRVTSAARWLPRFLALVWRQILPPAYAAEFPAICYQTGHLCVTADATGAFTASIPGADGERISIHLLDAATEEKGERLSGIVVKKRDDKHGGKHDAEQGRNAKEKDQLPAEAAAIAGDADAPKLKLPHNDAPARGAQAQHDQKKDDVAEQEKPAKEEKPAPSAKQEEKKEEKKAEAAPVPPPPSAPQPKGGGKK